MALLAHPGVEALRQPRHELVEPDRGEGGAELVLDRGRVAERGRATDLAGAGGTFARLLALQRARLDDDAFLPEYR